MTVTDSLGHNAANSKWGARIDSSLKNRIALVGGASQGIGQATAQLFAENGARVILLSRRAEALETVRMKLPSPDRHIVCATDLSDPHEALKALKALPQEVHKVDVWVNNSGGPKAGPLTDATGQDIEAAFRAHVLASQAILQWVLPSMKAQNFGRIINVLSTSVKAPIPNLGVSNLVRAAMASWAKTLSLELGAFGITVNNVLPGFTETPRLEALALGQAQKTGQSADAVKAEWAKQVPLKRLGDARETASAIVYLASAEAGYISGVQLPVDGGRTGAF